MRVIQIVSPGIFEIKDIPIPEIADNEVLIKVVSCVTCPHWDITLFKGVDIFERPGYPKYPIIPGYPGHEMAGDIVATGKDVKLFKVGNRVCTLYTAGEESTGFYCEFINRLEKQIVKIPRNISYEAAASMEMAFHVSPYVSDLGDIKGKRIGVVGMGPAGLIAIQMVKEKGAAEAVAIDLIDERLELAKRLGATEVVNSSKKEDMERLDKNRLNGCVECTGAASGLQIALDYTELGPISLFGVVHGEAKFSTRHWMSGVYFAKHNYASQKDIKYVLKLWQNQQLDTEALVTLSLPFEKYDQGIKLLMERKAIKVSFHP